MASWEDGPEYAPEERPTEFAAAPAPLLEVVPPPVRPAADAPKNRPAFDRPGVPVPQLVDLVPVVADQRDPGRPFDVAASTLTSMDSAWGAAHWSAPSGAPFPVAAPLAAPVLPGPTTHSFPSTVGAVTGAPAGYPAARQSHPDAPAPYPVDPQRGGTAQQPSPPARYGAPPVTAWPQPTSPIPAVGGPAQLPNGYPPPGTPQWFGPGPAVPPLRPPQGPIRFMDVATAATPGLLICLAVGGVLWFLAPVMLGVGLFLTSRIRVARDSIRKVFLFALGFVGLLALAGLMNGPADFGAWWSFVGICALVMCWALVITVLALVYRGLKTGRVPPPRTTSGWSGQ